MLNQHPILFWYTCVCKTQYEFIEFKSALYFELYSISNVALYFICRSNSINQSDLNCCQTRPTVQGEYIREELRSYYLAR